MTPSAFSSLLSKMNDHTGYRLPRKPGVCSPACCRAWDAGVETARVVEIVLAFESRVGRLAGAGDLPAVQRLHHAVAAETARVRAEMGLDALTDGASGA